MRNEGELCRKPFEKELRDLDLLLEHSFLSRRDSLANSLGYDNSDVEGANPKLLLRGSSPSEHLQREDLDATTDGHPTRAELVFNESGPDIRPLDPAFHNGHPNGSISTPSKELIGPGPNTLAFATQRSTPEDSSAITNGQGQGEGLKKIAETVSLRQNGASLNHVEPPTPPLSAEGEAHPLSNGGIPWYMEPFDPVGTTVEEERWTGRELVRGMSEELSDMDEDELSGLVDVERSEAPNVATDGTLHPESAVAGRMRPKAVSKRRRWRGYR